VGFPYQSKAWYGTQSRTKLRSGSGQIPLLALIDLTMILIYITCKNKNEAKNIGLALVKKRLVACVNIFPIGSIYWWKGKMVKDREVALIAKTLKRNFEKIEKEVKKLHSYNVPCILEIPIKRVNSKYLNWLQKEISK